MTIEEIGIAEAKARFSELVNRVAYAGDRIVITRKGKPVAVLSAAGERGLASVKGWLSAEDTFLKDLKEVESKRKSRRLRAAVSRKR